MITFGEVDVGVRHASAILVALCLMLGCGSAYAAADETEMTDDFVPIELGSGGSGDEGSSQSEAHAGTSESDGSRDDSSSPDQETELTGDDAGRQGDSDGGPSDAKAEPSGEGSPQAAGKDTVPAEGSGETRGIPLDDGSVVTVDDRGRLVLAGPGKSSRVLDESRTYTIEPRADGSAAILDDAGDEVDVEGTAVSFTDSEGKRTVVDVSDGSEKASGASDAKGGSETELSDEAGQAGATNQQTQAEDNALVVAVVVAIVAVAAVAGVVFWRRRKR